MWSPLVATAGRPKPAGGRAAAREAGAALVLAMVVAAMLALVVGGIAHLVVADLQMERLTQQEAEAHYLAQAAVEHQIYLLKAGQGAGAISYTNFPVSADQRKWYTTTLDCLLNCSGTVAARRWRITAIGEIRRYASGGSYVVVQTRRVIADVDITYDGASPLYATPTRVTVLRWEESLQ